MRTFQSTWRRATSWLPEGRPLDKPFQCDKCKNWYTPVTLSEGVFCMSCAEGTHAENAMTGVIDCHFGQFSSTMSERNVATAHNKALAARDNPHDADLLAQAEAEVLKLPEYLEWAGVMEMPGMKGERPEVRFKNLAALKELTDGNRRPMTDIIVLERSIKNCKEMAAEIPGILKQTKGGVKTEITDASQANTDNDAELTKLRQFKASSEANKERMARVRAKTKANKEKAAVSV